MSSRRFAQGAADAQQRLEGPADLSVASTRSLAAHTPSPFPSPPLRLPTGRGPTRPEQDEDPPEQVEAKIQQLLQLVLECRRFGKAGGNSQTAAAGTATDAAAVAEAAAVAAAAGAVRVRGGGLGTGRGGLVVHSGAGLSTAAGIPDFRGPKGVWTLQGEGRWEEAAAAMGRKYEEASPTVGHMAVAALVRAGIVQHVVTQNVTSPLPPNLPSELHGSVYRERCQVIGANGRPSLSSCMGWRGALECGAGYLSLSHPLYPSSLPSTSPPHLGTAFSRVDGITSSCLSELHGWSSGVPFPLTSLSLPLYPYSSPSTFPPHQWTAFTLEAASHQGVSRSCMDQCIARDAGMDGLHSRSGIPSDSLSELHGWWSGVPFPLTSLSLPIYPYSLPSTFPPTVDGLHSRSGIPSHRLSELHGSVYRESCLHFGERIDDEELRTAREASMGAHVALCLGSSFKVRLSGGGPFKVRKEVVGAAQADGPTHPLSVSSLNPPGPTSIKLPLLAIHICGINVHHAPCLPTTPLACPPRPLLAHYAPCLPTTPLACPPRPLLAHHAPCLPTTPLACPPRPLLAHHAPCLPTTPLACPPRPLLAHHAPCLPTTPLACPPRPLLAHHAPCLPTTSLACPPRPLLAHHALRLPLPLTSETSQRSLPAVPPASKLPRLAAHVVIINLQRTPLDRHASITIRARIDAVLPRLLHLLHLPLPAYNRHADPLLSLSSTPLHSITHAPRLPLFCTPPPSLLLKLSTQAAEEKGKEVNSDSPLKDNVPGATGDSTRPILFLHKATGTKGRRKKQKARTSFPRPTM
ncbi:unnamed protein product [Closterium sp. NIES-64]|nr:unnamed protein product [Closterium sp. NIES-64]